MKSFGVALILFCAQGAFGGALIEERVGKFYPLKQSSGDPLFLQKMRIDKTKPGAIEITGTIADSAGKEVLRERATIIDGRIQKQVMEQLQIGERYELEVAEGQVRLKSFKTGGAEGDKLEGETTEPLTNEFVTGPGMELFLLGRIAALEKGETVKGSFGIFEVLRSVNFEFRKEAASLSGVEGAIGLRMKPASFWLKLLVDPIYFDLDRATGRLLRFRGRTPVRVLEQEKWKPLDAEIIYEVVGGPAAQKAESGMTPAGERSK